MKREDLSSGARTPPQTDQRVSPFRKNVSASPIRAPVEVPDRSCRKMHIEDFKEYRNVMERTQKEAEAQAKRIKNLCREVEILKDIVKAQEEKLAQGNIKLVGTEGPQKRTTSSKSAAQMFTAHHHNMAGQARTLKNDQDFAVDRERSGEREFRFGGGGQAARGAQANAFNDETSFELILTDQPVRGSQISR